MRRLWLGLFLAGLATGVAPGDTVYLKNGRKLKGKLIQEDDTEVVLKTPGGRVPVPRKLIERIERTSAGQTALDMGLQRAREGDYARAREQFELAIADPDPAVRERAKRELEALPAGDGPTRGTGGRRAAPGAWPPERDQPLSLDGLRDGFGRPISEKALEGKIVLLELAGMQHPYSQAFAGGDTQGGFGGVTPQPDVANLQTQLERHAGVPPNHPELLVVQLLITGPDGKTAPTLEQAEAWATHFGHTRAANVQLWVGGPEHVEAGLPLEGMFVLCTPDGVVRFRSRNYPQLLPYIKKFVDAKHAGSPAPPSSSPGRSEAHPDDDYGHVDFTSIYPDDLESPPAGAPYPQALVPLPNPRSLSDVPARYRRFLNHAMTYVAKAALAKAHAIDALKRGGDVSRAKADYQREIGALIKAVGSLSRPQEESMSTARATLIAAFLTQRDLFAKAFGEVAAGTTTYDKVRAWSDVAEQEGSLRAVASILLERFDRAQPSTRQAITTHLGAMAGFPP
ncbi:MAG: hypothetical protein R3F62_01170 [Planctomycetota bacterium]